MYKIYFITLVSLTLAACGDQPAEVLKQPSSPVTESQPTSVVKLTTQPSWGDLNKHDIPIGGDCHMDVINGKPGEEIKNLSINLGDYLNVAGWGAISTEEGIISSSVAIALRSKSTPGSRFFAATSKTKRQDIADHFKNTALIESGFFVSAKVTDVQPGAYELEMIQFKDGKNYKCGQIANVIIQKQ